MRLNPVMNPTVELSAPRRLSSTRIVWWLPWGERFAWRTPRPESGRTTSNGSSPEPPKPSNLNAEYPHVPCTR